jgi:hypothetical protein
VPIHSYAKDVSFKWTANPEPLTGYKFYYKIGTNGGPPYDGTSLSGGSSPIFLDKKTTYTIKGLSPDETYQFTITAYNGAEESGYSTVLTVSGDSSLRPTIINITMQ